MNSENTKIIAKLKKGNDIYSSSGGYSKSMNAILREKLCVEGQHPHTIVVACSDSRVIPEAIFDTNIGELFVIRVAGNVLDNHQLGSIEYAASHLDANLILMLGHTGCGAVSATINSHGDNDKYIKYIMEDIREAIGDETDDEKATMLNVRHGVNVIKQAFKDHPEIESGEIDIIGAVYDIKTGKVEWLDVNI